MEQADSDQTYIRLFLYSKNHGHAMESLQVSLDTEQRAKAEGLRIKKKLDVSDDITKEDTAEDTQCEVIIKIIIIFYYFIIEKIFFLNKIFIFLKHSSISSLILNYIFKNYISKGRSYCVH